MVLVTILLVLTSSLGSSTVVLVSSGLSVVTTLSVMITVGSSLTWINETNGPLPVSEFSCTCTKATIGDNTSKDRSTLVLLINVELIGLVNGEISFCGHRRFSCSKIGL